MSVLNLKKAREKRALERRQRIDAEYKLRMDPQFRGLVDDIARNDCGRDRRTLAELLATKCFNAGWEAK